MRIKHVIGENYASKKGGRQWRHEGVEEKELVTVHTIAGSNDGFLSSPLAGSMARTRNSITPRPWARQLATTVSIRSTKRLPPGLSVP